MILLDLVNRNCKRITLTSERWNHIVLRHPEMEKHLEEIKEVLQDPDIIVQDRFDSTIKFYQKYYKEENCYITLVVQEEKSFIITAYITDSIKRGQKLWQKK